MQVAFYIIPTARKYKQKQLTSNQLNDHEHRENLYIKCAERAWKFSHLYVPKLLFLSMFELVLTHFVCMFVSSSFVSIISEFSHMFGQALAQWRAFSLAVARSSRLHSFSRSGHLSRCCMVCCEGPAFTGCICCISIAPFTHVGFAAAHTRAESVEGFPQLPLRFMARC